MPDPAPPPGPSGDDYLPAFRRAFDTDCGWEANRAHELAIFHSFAVPGISAILDRTGKFACHGQRRYDDTVGLLRQIGRGGPRSPGGHAAIRHLNRIHRPHGIEADDMRYVLATFTVIPVRWISRYGWRRLTQEEIRAAVAYYRDVGRHMGIRDIPQTYEEFETYLDAYERDHHAYADANRRLADALLNVIAAWFPRPARPLVRSCITAALGPPLRRSLGLPEPPAITRAGVHTALVARALLLRLIPPLRRKRKHPRQLRTYPNGYSFGDHRTTLIPSRPIVNDGRR